MASVTGLLLFLVPARGGSVRLPRKNTRAVAGIPLVARAVRASRLAAAALHEGDAIVACSTDDGEIGAIAAAWHARVIDRPAPLATADASSVDVALHALDIVERTDGAVRALVLVQPSAALVAPADLVAAVRRFEAEGGRPVVSVRATHPASWHTTIGDGGALVPIDVTADSSYLLAGAVYVISPTTLRGERSFAPAGAVAQVVPEERAVDVDQEVDLLAAEALAAAVPVRTFELDGRVVGGGDVFVIAEAGVNHNGDAGLAHRLVDAAADAGADCVKFQTFDPAALASATAPTAAYQQAAGARDDQRAMLEALALPPTAWEPLRDHARDRGLVFLSSPFDDASADLLERLGVPAFKVASGELTNLPFIRRLARVGRSLIVSTGMAEMVEVADAIDAIGECGPPGGPPVALLHCVSSYPARPDDANLRAMDTLRRAFAVPVGWSDHTPGIELAVAAAALGASIVEKHLTLDRAMPGPDHRSSLDPDAFASMVVGIRTVTRALGDGVKRPVDAERPIADVARKSLHWRVSLDRGVVVSEADLVALRPGTGIAPARIDTLAGARTVRRVGAGAAVVPEDVEPA